MEDFPLIPVLLGASTVLLAALVGVLYWKLRGGRALEVPEHVKQVQALVTAERFGEAAALEAEVGNSAAALNLYIQAGQHGEASRLAEQQSDPERAAALAETAGEVDRAATLYVSVRDFRAAGRLFKSVGRYREAAEAYEQDAEVDAGELAETWERACLEALGEVESLAELEPTALDALEHAATRAESFRRRRGDRDRAAIFRGVLDRHELDEDTVTALIARAEGFSDRLGHLARVALTTVNLAHASAPSLMSPSDFANAIKRSVVEAEPEEPMPEWADPYREGSDGGFEEVALDVLGAEPAPLAGPSVADVFDIWSSAGADDIESEFEEVWGATAPNVAHFDPVLDVVGAVVVAPAEDEAEDAPLPVLRGEGVAASASWPEEEDAPLPALRGEVALLPMAVAPVRPPGSNGFDDLGLDDLDDLPSPVTVAEAVVSEALAAADQGPAPGVTVLPTEVATSLREYLITGDHAAPRLAQVLDKEALTRSERAFLSRAVRQASGPQPSDVEAMLLDYLGKDA